MAIGNESGRVRQACPLLWLQGNIKTKIKKEILIHNIKIISNEI
jgi:hypothetical protein